MSIIGHIEKITEGSNTLYKLYAASGILKNYFSSDDICDMRNVCFPALQELDATTLEEISVIKASKINSNWNATAVQSPTICSCKSSCVSNKCKCKKAGLKCSTKCHKGIDNNCQNKF